jgi:pimeloyl-ACP methyl ester carboxylesterase
MYSMGWSAYVPASYRPRLRQVLARQDGPTVVAGHSYGGQIITALGTDAPNVVGLVYIAAFGIDEGESSEDDEQWRPLRVTFPDGIASHTREQLFFFGPDGLLRRHDYAVDILGGTTGADYALENREVNGIVVPTRRRVYGYEGNHEVVREPVLVAIDMGEIAFS